MIYIMTAAQHAQIVDALTNDGTHEDDCPYSNDCFNDDCDYCAPIRDMRTTLALAMIKAMQPVAQPDIPESIKFDSCQFWGSNEDGSGPFVFGQHPDGSKFLESINMKGWTCYGPVSSEGQPAQPEGFSPADMMDARKEAREQVQPVAQPLSDEQIDDLWVEHGSDDKCEAIGFARAIEQAHGIGAKE